MLAPIWYTTIIWSGAGSLAPAKNPGRCPAGTCLRRRCAPKEDDVYKPTHAAQPDRRPLWEALIQAAHLAL